MQLLQAMLRFINQHLLLLYSTLYTFFEHEFWGVWKLSKFQRTHVINIDKKFLCIQYMCTAYRTYMYSFCIYFEYKHFQQNWM